MLYDAAVANGAEVCFGMNVKSVDEQKPAVDLDDGTSIAADLVIAADGIVPWHFLRSTDGRRYQIAHSKPDTRQRRTRSHHQ